MLKRSKRLVQDEAVIEIADGIKIDTLNLCQLDSDKPLLFTRREIDILQFLQNHERGPVPREELLEQVWGYRHVEALETRTVDIHIAKLRRKIEPDPKQPRFLVTIRGQGYRLLSASVAKIDDANPRRSEY